MMVERQTHSPQWHRHNTMHHRPHTHHDNTRPYEPQHDYRQYKNKDYKPSTKTKTKTSTARNHTQNFFHTNYLSPTFPKPTNRRGQVSHNSSNPTQTSPTKATPNKQGHHVDHPGSPRSTRKNKKRNKGKAGHSPQQLVTHSNRPIKTQRNSTKPKIDVSTRISPPTSRPPICSSTCNRTVTSSSTEILLSDRKICPRHKSHHTTMDSLSQTTTPLLSEV
jgi:hypothetical protein